MFNAEDVEGILVDGQSDFMSVIQRAFALHNGTEQAVYRNNPDEEPAPQNEPEPQDVPEPDDDLTPSARLEGFGIRWHRIFRGNSHMLSES